MGASSPLVVAIANTHMLALVWCSHRDRTPGKEMICYLYSRSPWIQHVGFKSINTLIQTSQNLGHITTLSKWHDILIQLSPLRKPLLIIIIAESRLEQEPYAQVAEPQSLHAPPSMAEPEREAMV